MIVVVLFCSPTIQCCGAMGCILRRQSTSGPANGNGSSIVMSATVSSSNPPRKRSTGFGSNVDGSRRHITTSCGCSRRVKIIGEHGLSKKRSDTRTLLACGIFDPAHGTKTHVQAMVGQLAATQNVDITTSNRIAKKTEKTPCT